MGVREKVGSIRWIVRQRKQQGLTGNFLGPVHAKCGTREYYAGGQCVECTRREDSTPQRQVYLARKQHEYRDKKIKERAEQAEQRRTERKRAMEEEERNRLAQTSQ